MLSIFGSAWLFVPSKIEITAKKSEYKALEEAQLLDNVIQADGGYYPEMDVTQCQDNLKSKVLCITIWCKFK